MANKVLPLSKTLLCVYMVLFTTQVQSAATEVHPYAPFEVSAVGPSGNAFPEHLRSDMLSSRFLVRISGTEVAAIRYDNSWLSNQTHCMDVARFASDTVAPLVEIALIEGDDIESVTVHPVRYYPQSALEVAEDKRSVRFAMSGSLPYAIVAINGADPEDANDNNPQLTLINDPIASSYAVPDIGGSNVLDFKKFAEDYLRSHPIRDRVGRECREAGSVTDRSLNDEREFTWNHGKGRYMAYDSRIVAFPDKRVRDRNDVSEALQAALEHIKNTSGLNTLYIPAGVYLWSGLRIENWNGDKVSGGKPLYVYTDENALMVNRLKECREANEPAIFIYNSSFVTVSGRGMHDGQGCYTTCMDRKDARNTPHQGGAVVRKSHHIVFNDTYVRDSQQWNWETHNVSDVTLNNVKGLSPYRHAWIDGINLSSGKNIIVNGAVTLGNDDTFASGHYNPSDEFPARTYRENPCINLDDTDANAAELRNTFAAAGVYNNDRMQWSPDDTKNIRVSNTLGWTRTAHCIRIGLNTRIIDNPVDVRGRELEGFHFCNFNSVVGRKADGDIRILGFDGSKLTPVYKSMEIRNSSFWKPGDNWVRVETCVFGDNLIESFTLDNLYFVKPITSPVAIFSGVGNLILENIIINQENH